MTAPLVFVDYNYGVKGLKRWIDSPASDLSNLPISRGQVSIYPKSYELEEIDMEMTFSIGQVVKKTSVSMSRIREWQKKGYLLEAHRISVGGRQHRRFTEKDIQVIDKINRLQEEGLTLRAAAARVRKELDA